MVKKSPPFALNQKTKHYYLYFGLEWRYFPKYIRRTIVFGASYQEEEEEGQCWEKIVEKTTTVSLLKNQLGMTLASFLLWRVTAEQHPHIISH